MLTYTKEEIIQITKILLKDKLDEFTDIKQILQLGMMNSFVDLFESYDFIVKSASNGECVISKRLDLVEKYIRLLDERLLDKLKEKYESYKPQRDWRTTFDNFWDQHGGEVWTILPDETIEPDLLDGIGIKFEIIGDEDNSTTIRVIRP